MIFVISVANLRDLRAPEVVVTGTPEKAIPEGAAYAEPRRVTEFLATKITETTKVERKQVRISLRDLRDLRGQILRDLRGS